MPSREPPLGKPCRGCGTLTLCEIVPHPMKVNGKVPLCPDCVSIYREQPEKRGLLPDSLSIT